MLLFFQKNEMRAQCNPDVTPPSPVCTASLTAALDANGQLTIWPSDIDDGSFDNCSAIDFFLEEAQNSTSPPTTQSLDFTSADIGTHNIVLWAVDQAGNNSNCFAVLEITGCQGTSTLACNSLTNISLPPSGETVILPDTILEGGPYCSTYGIDFLNGGGFPGLAELPVDTNDIGSHTVVVFDAQTGSSCWGTVVVQGFSGGGSCSPDLSPPVAICDAFTVVQLNPVTGQATVNAQVFDDGSYDNCPGDIAFYVEKGLPPSAVPPTAQSLTFNFSEIGTTNVVLWAVDAAGNNNLCVVQVQVNGCTAAAPACNSSITVGIPVSGSIEIDPSMILEGGPYCNPMGIGFTTDPAPGFPFVTLDTSHIGTTQTLVVYDNVTGSSCFSEVQVIDCQNDTTVPTAICVNGLVAEMGKIVPHELTVWAMDFDDGSFDNCTPDLIFRIEESSTPSSQVPGAESLTFDEPEIGTHDIVMWVVDAAGNENPCTTTLEIIPPKCNSDTSPPICTAPADTFISKSTFEALGIEPDNESELAVHFGEADADDNCGVDTIAKSVTSIYSGACGLKSIIRTFRAVDLSGNMSAPCRQVIDIINDWSIHLPADFHFGNAAVDSLRVIAPDGTLFAVNYQDEVIESDCDDEAEKIIRTWTAINWCETDSISGIATMPRLDIDGDDIAGDGYDILKTADGLTLLENGTPTTVLAPVSFGLTYTQILLLSDVDPYLFGLEGTVFHDANTDCGFDGGEMTLAGWTVTATGLVSGNVQQAVTDSSGHYLFPLCTSDTLAEVSLDVPFNYGQSCGTTHTVQFSPGMAETIVQDIPVHFDMDCPILWVDLAAPFLRRCFENYYTVSYCNYSDSTIEDVHVEVQLDPFMDFLSSEITGTPLGGNLYSFELGDVAAGDCGDFRINFDLSCDATLGATHCVDAHIYPDTICPNPTNWSGANIEVDAYCQNDSIHLSIANTGTAAMAGPLDYIVVEDVIMLQSNPFNLGPNEVHELTPFPATGATYRIEAPQEPGHPYQGNVAKAVEGCGGFNLLGLVNLFPLENPNPFIATDCQQNIGSFDPNDKQAFPTGYGEGHFIKRNTDIDYLIRFQNTGTDKAFNIVITDELDPALDPASVRPGASSHDYKFELVDGNMLRFTFANILLPDSTTDEVASHGFVKFKASQKAGLPLGTVIENEAAIYFDFNEPIITNTVFHTIGEHFIEIVSDTDERPAGLGELLTYPNPSFGDVTFKIPGKALTGATFILHNALGKQLVVEPFAANTFLFERKGLAPGVYFYKVEIDGLGRYSGKIILQ